MILAPRLAGCGLLLVRSAFVSTDNLPAQLLIELKRRQAELRAVRSSAHTRGGTAPSTLAGPALTTEGTVFLSIAS
jgi:hypothetical protein